MGLRTLLKRTGTDPLYIDYYRAKQSLSQEQAEYDSNGRLGGVAKYAF